MAENVQKIHATLWPVKGGWMQHEPVTLEKDVEEFDMISHFRDISREVRQGVEDELAERQENVHSDVEPNSTLVNEIRWT